MLLKRAKALLNTEPTTLDVYDEIEDIPVDVEDKSGDGDDTFADRKGDNGTVRTPEA